MMKKLCSILLISIMLVASGISVFGYSKTVVTSDTIDDEVIYDADTKTTEQFLVKIAISDNKAIIFFTDEYNSEDIGVMLLIYDIKKDKFVDFMDAENQKNWGFSKWGTFTTEIKFPVHDKEIDKYKNRNDEYKFRVVAFKKSEADSIKISDNLQVSDFKITVLDEGFGDKVANSILKIKSMLKSLLK